jgi:shikimate dehydrogenase
MGWPISHSLSPRLHGYWLKTHCINGTYEAMAVKPEALARTLDNLSANGFAGVNVTVPHKEAALTAVDTIRAEAVRTGAVNTVVVRPDETLLGRNTDVYGFMKNLKSNYSDLLLDQGPAVVLGAGGAARAVCASLIDGGVAELRLVNRTLSRAEALAGHIGGPIKIYSWKEREKALDGALLLVNATSLGLGGGTALEINLTRLPRQAVVNDIVYTPLETPLLRAAAKRGNPVVDGLGMLLYQAQPGFAAWFGVEPEVTPGLRSWILKGLPG